MQHRMELIVKTVIEKSKFRTDYYHHDLKEMTKFNHFAWFVYDCGTALIPFIKEEIEQFENEWLATIDDFKIKTKPDPYRLYLCNVQKGSVSRVHECSVGNLYLKLQNLL